MTYGKKRPFIASSGSDSSTIVIVEDFMSAIRVGESVDAYCMFGTAVPYEQLQDIVKKYDRIVVWTDSDKAGRTAASKLTSIIKKLINSEVRNRAFAKLNKIVLDVLTDLDPKCYTNSEIRQILKTEVTHENHRNREYS